MASEAAGVALAMLVTASACADLATRRIPNWLTVSGALLGVILHASQGGLQGALASLAGAGLGLGIFLPFYAAGGMGAGDVKLFGAVGAFVGPQGLLLVFVFTGLVGGLSAFALAASRRRAWQALERAAGVLSQVARRRAGGVRRTETPPASDSLRLPYGAVIAAGTLVSLVLLP